MSKLSRKVADLESRIFAIGGKFDKFVTSDFVKNWRVSYTSEILGGIYLALCVNTKDPLKRNRVQFFTSMLNDKSTSPADLPWANPISVLGGFDDSGVTWIPPAGSTIVIAFVGGSRNAPFYLGTIHQVSRGTSPYQWGYEIQEYYDIWDGHRKGYLVGPNDGSQLLPPWTSEQYNAVDSAQFDTFDDDPQAFDKITYAHIYGIKTGGKYGWKIDEGDYKCNNRWSRSELFSGRGNILLFKDDHLNPCGQHTNPKCTKKSGGDLSNCSGGGASCGTTKAPDQNNLNQGANPYAKREEECRLYKGANTPQNNACVLSQSGYQLQSLSGHYIFADDSVEQPSGVPTWELDFDFGCTDKFTGKMGSKSATGHSITLNDKESDTGVRADGNGIELKTASGIKLSLNDHTTGSKPGGCPPNLAGDKRGFHIETTAQNTFDMVDAGNKQCSPARKEGGESINKATGAYIQLRTGYGIRIKMSDTGSQENTANQSFEIISPQKDNTKAGPHMLVMQESTSQDGGFLFLRAGGIIETISYNHNIESVGTADHPASKIVEVSDSYLMQSKSAYFSIEQSMLVLAKQNIYLLAGQDCVGTDGSAEPCVMPLICFNPATGGLVISDKLFGSASPSAAKVQLSMVMQNPE